MSRINRALSPSADGNLLRFEPLPLQRVLNVLVVLLIVKVTVSIVAGYRDYFPANFEADFLRGRDAYFSGVYSAAFYAHIVSGPISLLLGLLLVAEGWRSRLPKVHRALGKAQVLLVLLVLSPSGLWMAFYAEAFAAVGFTMLAIGTAVCVGLGWRSAVLRRFDEHRRWMWRCFLLLCSAVVLRLIGGLASVTGIGGEWSYPVAAWVSWLMPLAGFEWYAWRTTREGPHSSTQDRAAKPARQQAEHQGETQSTASASTSSLPAMEIIARR